MKAKRRLFYKNFADLFYLNSMLRKFSSENFAIIDWLMLGRGYKYITWKRQIPLGKSPYSRSVFTVCFSLQHCNQIEDIYFFEVNIKYISSSAVKKISIFHECVARVKMLIFSPHEMKYIWYLPRKSKFSFYFILNGNTEITTLLFTWSFLVRFDFCSVFIGYNIGCKHSLHLENGLESYFN